MQQEEVRDLNEVFCYLACLGPETFAPQVARALVMKHSTPGSEQIVSKLLDPLNRGSISQTIGTFLASLPAENSISALLPKLLAVDTELGFTVLRNMAIATPRSKSQALSELLLSLTIAEGEFSSQAATTSTSIKHFARQRYLLSVLAVMDLDSQSRARLFLALSQNLHNEDLIRALVMTPLFPSSAEEGVMVLTEGNEDAIKALLNGVALRPHGKAEFYAMCKAVTTLGLQQGLMVLGRVHRQISMMAETTNLRAMASVVRASTLLAIEDASRARKELQLPLEPNLSTLYLLALVAPGVKEPTRSRLCDYMLCHCASIMRNTKLMYDMVDPLLQIVISSAVLYPRADEVTARVRKMILDAFGAHQIRLQSINGPRDEHIESFRVLKKLVTSVALEFRRRQSIATALESILPLVASAQEGVLA